MSSSDPSSKDRMEAFLKSPYPTDEGTIWNAFLEAFAEQFEQYDDVVEDVLDSKFVSDAGPAQLNRLGELFGMQRRRDEDIGTFRARIKTALPAQMTSATLPEISEMIAVLLDLDEDEFEIEEPIDEIAVLRPRIPAQTMGESGIPPSALNELLGEVSAAGVRAEARFMAGVATIRLVAGSAEIAPMTELESFDLDLGMEDVQHEQLNDAGLSSVNLDPLSSGTWTL